MNCGQSLSVLLLAGFKELYNCSMQILSWKHLQCMEQSLPAWQLLPSVPQPALPVQQLQLPSEHVAPSSAAWLPNRPAALKQMTSTPNEMNSAATRSAEQDALTEDPDALRLWALASRNAFSSSGVMLGDQSMQPESNGRVIHSCGAGLCPMRHRVTFELLWLGMVRAIFWAEVAISKGNMRPMAI